jgi:FtsP/CotA-like multicopper oxidase with cupredoxin domain
MKNFLGALILMCLVHFSWIIEARGQAPVHHARVRVYFIAAEEVNWNYIPSGRDDAMGQPLGGSLRKSTPATADLARQIWKKAIFREYLDAKFSLPAKRSEADEYLGILGPTLRGEVGDTIKVVFKNKASRPYSMHPHGMLYAKDSEGVMYNDHSGEADKSGGMVPPGGTFTYVWQIPERAGPGPNDPSSIIWLYHSHVDELRDIASGLFGPIIVTAKGKAHDDATPVDVDREFITVFISINENESWYGAENTKNLMGMVQDSAPGARALNGDRNLQHSINGYMFGNMPMISMKRGERVRWYVGTLGDSNNFHTPHWHGNVVSQNGHRMDVVALLPAQTVTVDMVPDDPGIWLFHCHVSDHMAGGMVARYQVKP